MLLLDPLSMAKITDTGWRSKLIPATPRNAIAWANPDKLRFALEARLRPRNGWEGYLSGSGVQVDFIAVSRKVREGGTELL